MHTFSRYFSRLLVMKINLTGYKKCTGDARRLEDAAREASSALPFILSTPNTVSPVDVHKEVENLQFLLKRIMEGIALQILLARKVRYYLSFTLNVNKDISDRINLPFKMLRFHFNISFVCFRSSTLPWGMTWCHLSLGTTKKFWYLIQSIPGTLLPYYKEVLVPYYKEFPGTLLQRSPDITQQRQQMMWLQ